MRSRIKIILFLILILGTLCLALRANAQNLPPSIGIIQEKMQDERGDFLREREIEKGPIIPEIEDQRPTQVILPEEVEGTVYIEKFVLRGVTEFEPEAFTNFLYGYKDRELGIKELNEIADSIQSFYRKKGYITTIVYIPVQNIKDNTVEIRVIEGHVGQIRLEGAKYTDSEYLRDRLSIRAGDRIAYKDLVKRVRNLNVNPDRTVKAILAPGELLDTTDIVLKVEEQNPQHLFMEYNNFGTRYTGKHRYTLGYVNNNVSGTDDMFSLRLERSDMKLYGASIDYNFLLSPAGTRFGAYGSYVYTDIGKEFDILDANGRSITGGFYINHPFTSGLDNFQGNFNVGFGIKRNKNYILGTVSSNDKLSIAKMGLSMDYYDDWGRTFSSIEAEGGIPYFAGALGRNDPQASRFDAGGNFAKVKANISRRQNLPWSSFVLLSARGQYSPDRLVSSEQFYIGGADTVRGYPELEYMGDYGYILSSELRTPAFIFPEGFKLAGSNKPLRDAVQFVYFWDYGHAFLRNPLVGEKEKATLMSVGAGLRLNLWDDFYIRADWGVPLHSEPSDGADNKIHIWAHLDLI